METIFNSNQIPSPCYLLDEQLFLNNLKLISDVQSSSGARIILALKGFAMWRMFPLMKNYGICHAAASSLSEAITAYSEFGAKAYTYAPAYAESEFDCILKHSKHITFNSLSQLAKYGEIAEEERVSVGLRVNPEYSDTTSELYDPCAAGSRLGVVAEDLPEELPEYVDGFHVHNLCEASAEAFKKTLESVERLYGKYLPKLKWLNMGGGHLMTRKGYNIELLVKTIKDFKQKYDIELILEPGSAFAWETGYLVSTVLDVVENRGVKTAILDISFTCHMPDCLEMPYQPRIIGAEQGRTTDFVYRMGGNSCLAGDYMGDWSFKKELKIGDRLYFDDMIHYTMVKTSNFNGIGLPSIGVWRTSGYFKLIRSFDHTYYKNRIS